MQVNTNNGITQSYGYTAAQKAKHDKEPINDNFSRREEYEPEIEFTTFDETVKAYKQAAIDKATGAEKDDLQMRMYWSEYSDMLGAGPGNRNNINMETMYSKATDIYKQIEESSDSEKTKVLKKQALENALNTGTSMYAMHTVIDKMRNDAEEAEAQGKTIDRSYRSKEKFDKLSAMSGEFQSITSLFFKNLKSGKGEGIDYGAMVSGVVSNIMSYKA